MSNIQRKTVKTASNQVVDVFHINPAKIYLARSNHCDSIDDTKTIDAFTGTNVDSHGLARGNLPSEQREREGEAPTALPLEGATRAPIIELAFPSGLHGKVLLRRDAAGNVVQPRQAVAYWQPIGLRRGGGISSAKQVDKYATGVFLIDKFSKPTILALPDVSENLLAGAQLAIQTGPLLVRDGRVVPALDVDYPMGKTPRAMVGIDKNGKLLLARIPFEVTLEEAANFMMKQGALSALNLQGDSGAVFWFDGKIHPSSNREPARFCEVMLVKP